MKDKKECCGNLVSSEGAVSEADRVGITAVAPRNTQVGGDHYVNCAIQPLDYAVENKLDPFQFSIVKYVTRMYSKGQCLSDIDKIIHFAELAKANAIKKDIT